MQSLRAKVLTHTQGALITKHFGLISQRHTPFVTGYWKYGKSCVFMRQLHRQQCHGVSIV